MNQPKISVVMAYFNRKQQCLITLDTIQRSEAKNRLEVIIVDDGSAPEHSLSGLDVDRYSFPIHIWKVRDGCKSWRNPVVSYNFGISKAQGEWIILQNPEVCHIGDICNFVDTRADPKIYYAFQVFATKSPNETQLVTDHLLDIAWISSQLGKQIQGQWYCHHQYRSKAYHFCTAIHRTKLELVGGFNPSFQNGIDYDDDELLCRISRVCPVAFVNDPQLFGIHQWHPSFSYQGDKKEIAQLQARNRALFHQIINQPKIIKVNIATDSHHFEQIK